jgi:hypothetical protein
MDSIMRLQNQPLFRDLATFPIYLRSICALCGLGRYTNPDSVTDGETNC